HGLGHPELLDLRLAAPVLPDERRVHGDVPGADRDDGLGGLRPRPRPAVRELHGALRLRADGRARDQHLAEGVAARVRRGNPAQSKREASARKSPGAAPRSRTGTLSQPGTVRSGRPESIAATVATTTETGGPRLG